MKLFSDLLTAMTVGIIIVWITQYSLSHDIFVGPIIFLMGVFPMLGGIIRKIELKRMLPDMIFGAIDTGLLVLAALIGARFYGVIGAIAGSAVGDALTDGIAGFFEGGISEFLRKRGIEESRTAIGSSMGKMSGCLFGSGFMLTLFLGLL